MNEAYTRSDLLDEIRSIVIDNGFLSDDAVEKLSTRYHLPAAWIYGQASQFRELPLERTHLRVRICTGPCCALAGSLELARALRSEIGEFKGKARAEEVYGLPYWHLPIAVEISGWSRKTRIYHAFDGNMTILKKVILGEGTSLEPPLISSFGLKDLARITQDAFSLRSMREESRLAQYRRKGGMAALASANADAKKSRKALDQSGLADFHDFHPLSRGLERLLAVDPGLRMIVCDAGGREVENGVSGMAADYNPYAVLEGMLILASLAGAREEAIYFSWQDEKTRKAVSTCLSEISKAGLLEDIHVRTVMGPAFLPIRREIGIAAVAEGKMLGAKAAETGFAEPTIDGKDVLFVSAETLSKIPTVFQRGAAAYRKLGGTTLVPVMGRIKKPRVIEVGLNTSVGEIARSASRSSKIKALHLHGTSGAPLPPERFGMALGKKPTDSFGATGASLILLDERTCMVRWASYLARLSEESCCGACVPGRNAPGVVAGLLDSIIAGRVDARTLKRIISVIRMAEETALCPQVLTTLRPVLHSMEYFQGEFEAHVEERCCPAGECKL